MSSRSTFVTPCPALAGSLFRGDTVCSHRQASIVAPRRDVNAARIYMRSAANLEKKTMKVEGVQGRLKDAQLVFQVPLRGIAMSQITKLKRSLPEGSTMQTVKNTLMLRAIEGTDWEVLGDLCKDSTIWLFVDEDIKGTVDAYKKFLKDNRRDETILGGAMDNVVYDTAGIEHIASLPSKDELYAQIAMLVQMVPQKLASSVKAVPTKLGCAVKLALVDEDESPTDSASAEASEGVAAASE